MNKPQPNALMLQTKALVLMKEALTSLDEAGSFVGACHLQLAIDVIEPLIVDEPACL